MAVIFSKFVAFTNRHPIVRGMISYATIWPISNLIQQSMAGKNPESWDYTQMVHFSIFGAFYMAPTLYTWIRVSSIIWPKNNFRSAVTKAVVEQFTYGPFAVSSFHFGVSKLEGKTFDESIAAVKDKFFPTWKVGLFYWSFLQTINFSFMSEKNRVPFVSCCSLVWGCFLSYMHHTHETKKDTQELKTLDS